MNFKCQLIIIVLMTVLSNAVISQIIIHSENFNAGIGMWSTVDESDATDQWTATGGYMDINGFGGSNDIDWLISPAINMNAQANEYFMFDYFDNFSGNLIELYYSLDYNGGGALADVTAATWTSIPLVIIDFDATSCSSSAFQRHPAIDISAIVGANVYFAFYYTGLSGSSKNYRIDDVHIEGDYYAGITATDCAPLKSELHNLISVQPDRIRYTSSLYDVWDAVLHTDRRRNDANTATIVWDMFTDIPAGTGEFEFDHCTNRDNGSCPGGEGVCYNREHTFPRSWWGGGTTLADTQNTDMHHIYASDRSLNSAKSNYPPGIVTSATTTGSNGFMVGSNPGQPCAINYFEPLDEYKGDYARTFFYFVTRYEHNMVAWAPINARGDCFLEASTYPSIDPWGLTLMLQWHAADPVSQKEIDHNNAVYAIQGNRNPYIDSPNWVNFVWGDEFGAPCSSITLPIELISFSARQSKDQILLDWVTASEESSAYFSVERSSNVKDWTQIDKIDAAGYSTEKLFYQTTDASPIPGTAYYRLKLIDLDGSFEYSRIASIQRNIDDEVIYYPNPFKNTLSIDGLNSSNDIKIYTTSGVDCSKLIHIYRKNDTTIEINTRNLEPGLYLIYANNSSYKVIKK